MIGDFFLIFYIFLLLNSVYTVLPLSQGLDGVKGGTIHMKTVKYEHTKIVLKCLYRVLLTFSYPL